MITHKCVWSIIGFLPFNKSSDPLTDRAARSIVFRAFGFRALGFRPALYQILPSPNKSLYFLMRWARTIKRIRYPKARTGRALLLYISGELCYPKKERRNAATFRISKILRNLAMTTSRFNKREKEPRQDRRNLFCLFFFLTRISSRNFTSIGSL